MLLRAYLSAERQVGERADPRQRGQIGQRARAATTAEVLDSTGDEREVGERVRRTVPSRWHRDRWDRVGAEAPICAGAAPGSSPSVSRQVLELKCRSGACMAGACVARARRHRH